MSARIIYPDPRQSLVEDVNIPFRIGERIIRRSQQVLLVIRLSVPDRELVFKGDGGSVIPDGGEVVNVLNPVD